MRKTLKFLHTMGAIGFCGALAALLVIQASLPEPEQWVRFAELRRLQGAVARWLLLPSMGTVVVSGLLSMGATTAYHSAGWVWAKLATGILIFEGTLVYVQGPMERAAREAAATMDGTLDPGSLGMNLSAEWNSFWIILGVGVANVVLGIWRPRFSRAPSTD